jgi:hypothetical protein
MNLKVLPINVMLAQSKRWLVDAETRAPVEAHPLGAAALAEVQKAHDRLALQGERRRRHELALAELTGRIGDASGRHDRKARALHAALQAVIEGTDDPALSRTYLDLQQLLFPEGLAIVTRSYTYQAGAIEALECRMTADHLLRLAVIVVRDETLTDWYRAWVEAGHALGKLVTERDIMLKRAGRGGTTALDLDLRAARTQWISTVRAFLAILDLIEISHDTREALLSPLEACVVQAQRHRDTAAPPEPAAPAEPGAVPSPGDAAETSVLAPANDQAAASVATSSGLAHESPRQDTPDAQAGLG